MPSLQNQRFLEHAVDEIGMPNLDFWLFYQQGLSCYRWSLPKQYVRQALRALSKRYRSFGVPAFWQLRAFAYGLRGLDDTGQLPRYCSDDFKWPLPPDESWAPVICIYPDGLCDMDFAHPVRRRFWSEDNGHLILPCYDSLRMGGWWFEEMGFNIMRMEPNLILHSGAMPGPHLKAVE